jgi:hypothetical protein
VPVKAQKGVLGDILGLFAASHHSHQQPENPTFMTTHQEFECPFFSVLPAPNQV